MIVLITCWAKILRLDGGLGVRYERVRIGQLHFRFILVLPTLVVDILFISVSVGCKTVIGRADAIAFSVTKVASMFTEGRFIEATMAGGKQTSYCFPVASGVVLYRAVSWS